MSEEANKTKTPTTLLVERFHASVNDAAKDCSFVRVQRVGDDGVERWPVFHSWHASDPNKVVDVLSESDPTELWVWNGNPSGGGVNSKPRDSLGFDALHVYAPDRIRFIKVVDSNKAPHRFNLNAIQRFLDDYESFDLASFVYVDLVELIGGGDPNKRTRPANVQTTEGNLAVKLRDFYGNHWNSQDASVRTLRMA